LACIGKIICGLDGEVALVAEHSPGSGKRVLTELPRCVMLTERVQVASKIDSEADRPDEQE
jgi:hypothetical protein